MQIKYNWKKTIVYNDKTNYNNIMLFQQMDDNNIMLQFSSME